MGSSPEAILTTIASYQQDPTARVLSIIGDTVTVQDGQRRYVYRGVRDCIVNVGELVKLPLPCRSWSMSTKWSPFDVPSEYDIDDE